MLDHEQQEHGQALVLLVFALVALLIVAGLALDGGMALLDRRRMQNAADASALAGTRRLAKAICDVESATEADAAIYAEVVDYAQRNGVQQASSTVAQYVKFDAGGVVVEYSPPVTVGNSLDGGAGVPEGAAGIALVTSLSRKTALVSLAGVEESNASAYAQAISGPLTQFPGGGGILPIGVPLLVVDGMESGDDFSVIDVLNQHSGGSFCVDQNNNGHYDDPEDYCYTDPGVPHNAHRGWLNLNYIYNMEHRTAPDPLNRAREQNVGNNQCNQDPPGLRGYGSGDCPYEDPIFAGAVGGLNGDFIHGSPGAKASALTAIIDSYAGTGKVVYAPIFDYIYIPSDLEDNGLDAPEEPDGYHLSGDNWPNAGGGSHAFLYHVVGFVGLHVNGSGPSGKNLEGDFVEALIGDGLVSPNSGYNPTSDVCAAGQLYTIRLFE